MTVTATLNGTIIARSEETVVVEGNHYFPAADVDFDRLEPTRSHTLCPWKGIASYWAVSADGVRVEDGAFGYRHPSPFARRIKGRVAFWNGVDVQAR